MARIDRAELGDFGALVLRLLLIWHFKRHLVVPNPGFYGSDAYEPRQRGASGRGVNFQAALKLRIGVLLM
jgi:hypothetical protein